MSHLNLFNNLRTEFATYFAHLNASQLLVLFHYVLGVIVGRCAGQMAVCAFLSALSGEKMDTLRQRVRELMWDAEDKAGKKRRSLEVALCFAPLLRWVETKVGDPNQPLVLAMDATYLKDRFVILAVSVVVAGTAIPVAWHIQRGDEKGAWNPIWKRLLEHLRPAIAPERQVIVLTDSGLFSRDLFLTLLALDCVPMMRLEAGQGLFQALGESDWLPLKGRVWHGMEPQVVSVNCFKGKPIRCTLVFQWRQDCDKPCLIATSLPPEAVTGNVYALRYWIEAGFKDFKSDLFNWQETKMTCPKRAERLWLVMSIALLQLTTAGIASPLWHWSPARRSRYRPLSAPKLGWIAILVSLLKAAPCPHSSLHPSSSTPSIVNWGLNAYP